MEPLPRGIEERPEDFGQDHRARLRFEQGVFEEMARSEDARSFCVELGVLIEDWLRASAYYRARAVSPAGEDVHALARLMFEESASDLANVPTPFAGRVARDPKKVLAVLRGGQIRECFLHFDMFLRKRFILDVVCSTESMFLAICDKSGRLSCLPWLERVRKSGRDHGLDDEQDVAARARIYKEALTQPGTPFDLLRRNAKRLDYKRRSTPADQLHERYLVALCQQEGIDCPPEARAAALEARRNIQALEGERHPYAWSRVPKTDLYVELSEREREFTNPIDSGWVPYIRGDYANELDATHPWVQAALQDQFPLRAGPSGTAHRLLVALIGLGFPARRARRVIAGYLAPIHAHSCHEILYATDRLGDCRYDPRQYAALRDGDRAAVTALAAILFEEDAGN